jgi:hypothetical protein
MNADRTDNYGEFLAAKKRKNRKGEVIGLSPREARMSGMRARLWFFFCV